MYSSNAQPTGTNRPRACHPPTTHTVCYASTTQNLNQQPTPHHPTHQPPQRHGATGNGRGNTGTRSQQNNGSQRYGGHSGRETPGPIPNPEVKPASANGTAPDRMWESRTPPNIFFTGATSRWPLCAFLGAFLGYLLVHFPGQGAAGRPQRWPLHPSSTGPDRPAGRGRCRPVG